MPVTISVKSLSAYVNKPPFMEVFPVGFTIDLNEENVGLEHVIQISRPLDDRNELQSLSIKSRTFGNIEYSFNNLG